MEAWFVALNQGLIGSIANAPSPPAVLGKGSNEVFNYGLNTANRSWLRYHVPLGALLAALSMSHVASAQPDPSLWRSSSPGNARLCAN